MDKYQKVKYEIDNLTYQLRLHQDDQYLNYNLSQHVKRLLEALIEVVEPGMSTIEFLDILYGCDDYETFKRWFEEG